MFKFGVYNITFYIDFLLNRYAHVLRDKWCCSSKENYNTTRVEQSKKLLKDIGGEPFSLIPQDQEAQVNGLLMKASLIKDKIEKLGGKWERIQHNNMECFAVIPPKNPDQDWRIFFDLLQKMHWPKEKHEGVEVLITARNVKDVPSIGSPGRKAKCMILPDISSPYGMSRRKIGAFLGMGLDIAAYNGRGVDDSVGYASEGGAYLDSEAVVEFLKGKHYIPSEICINGSCGDTLIGMGLFKKYFAQGINAFFENPSISITEVASRKGWFVSTLTSMLLSSIQAPSKSKIRSLVQEDGFDSLKKINSLKPHGSKKNIVLFAATEGDEMTPPDKVKELYKALTQKVGECCLSFFETSNPKDSPSDRDISDPHLRHPYRNPKIQRSFMDKFLCHLPNQEDRKGEKDEKGD